MIAGIVDRLQDIVRQASYKLFSRDCPPISDSQLLSRMQCNTRGTLLLLLRKEKQGELLSRAEWRFLAQMSNRTYDSAMHRLEVIDRELVTANILAFGALLSLRDEQYPAFANQHKDGYYRGNMSFSWTARAIDTSGMQAFVRTAVNGLPVHPSAGCGAFGSRNLDVALRTEPPLDPDRLGRVLQPFLHAALLVCLRGYWSENAAAILTDRDRPDGRKKTGLELSMIDTVALEPQSNPHFHLSPYATSTTISVAIEARHHGYVFSLNDYVELTGFAAMLERISPDTHNASMPDFEFGAIPPYSKMGPQRYILASGRWRLFFDEEEFESLKDLLSAFVCAPCVGTHLGKLEKIYGKL
jgi:hypothetical protein